MTTLSPRARALTELWYAAESLSATADKRLGAIHGIAFREFMVLRELEAAVDGRLRRVDLAEAIGRSPSGVTRLLRPMEKIGLVDNGASDRDARVRMVGITAAGRRILRDASTTLEQIADKLMLPVGDVALDTMIKGLALLRSP